MSTGDKSLSDALNQLSQASDIEASEVEEVARVRKARAKLTEQARKSGDNASNLLSNLLGSVASEENDIHEAARKRKAEEEEKKRAKREAEEEKKRLQSEKLLKEEKKRLEDIEKRRLQMLADLEKKRRAEAGEVDEEEEARKRMQAEAEAQRIADEAAREREEYERTQALIRENQAKLDILKPKPVDPEIARREQFKKRIMIGAAAAVVILSSGSLLTYYFVNKKAPDFYTLTPSYETTTLTLEAIPAAGLSDRVLAKLIVQQEAPKVVDVRSNRPRIGSNTPTDEYGIGKIDTSNLLSNTGGKVVH